MATRTKTICKVLVFNTASQILLIRRSETDTKRPLQWDFPGGNVEIGEDFYVACVREVAEEVNLQVKKTELHFFFCLNTLAEYDMETTNINWLFFATTVSKGAVQLSFEHDQYQWVELMNVQKIINFEPFKAALDNFNQIKK